MKNCYLCIISTFCGNDTQTFYNCLRRGFRRGASCICISIKKKAISERYTIKTASRLLQNDIACPADRGGSPTMRTNPGNKMTKRTSRQRTTFFSFFLNTFQRSPVYLSRAKGKKLPHERSEHRRFFTRRVKRPFTNAACGVTFVPENRKITCPFRNLYSFLASSGVPDLPPAASFWE